LLRSGVIGKLVAIHATPGRGGVAMIGTHFFDFARWIVGSEFVKARAELDEVLRSSHRGSQFVDRSGRCEACFQNGVRLTVDLSDDIAPNHGYLLLVGEAGRIEIDEKLGRARLLGSGRRVWEREYVWPGLQAHGVAAALLNLAGDGPLRCTLVDGKAALEVAIASNLSAREGGRWVDLPLTGPVRAEVFPFA
jgi:predicted dehydrogenase